MGRAASRGFRCSARFWAIRPPNRRQGGADSAASMAPRKKNGEAIGRMRRVELAMRPPQRCMRREK